MNLISLTREQCAPFILETHYARRWPAYSHAYGFCQDGAVKGVVLYGRPSMKTVRTGVAGPDHERDVWELTRLCIRDSELNQATQLISKSIRLLLGDVGAPGALILSFADPEQQHHGGVYQAASFGYYGLTAKKSHWQFVRDFVEADGRVRKAGMHCSGVVGIFKGQKNRRQLLVERYGDAVQWVPRPRKHRYIRVAGSRSYKRKMLPLIRYKKKPYPRDY
jgi:hypothetical protein